MKAGKSKRLLIGGYCFGAWIAFEMARQMEKRNWPAKFSAASGPETNLA
jgi:alpha/beta superfamily hydrolase